MGVAILLERQDKKEPDYYSLVGASELKTLWMPIIKANNLHFLEYACTASFDVEEDNYEEFMSEIETLLAELKQRRSRRDSIENPIFRCERLVRLLKENAPENPQSARINIG